MNIQLSFNHCLINFLTELQSSLFFPNFCLPKKSPTIFLEVSPNPISYWISCNYLMQVHHMYILLYIVENFLKICDSSLDKFKKVSVLFKRTCNKSTFISSSVRTHAMTLILTRKHI